MPGTSVPGTKVPTMRFDQRKIALYGLKIHRSLQYLPAGRNGMRNYIWFAPLLTVLGVIVVALANDDGSPEAARAANAQYGRERLKEIAYIKDTRPDPPICYAFNRGPMLAAVPCESVEHLIDQK